MARPKCIECGKGKGLFGHNYAGLDVKNFPLHPYPDRIQQIIMPGNNENAFLCADCANKRKVVCNTHGVINDEFSWGIVPTCSKCKEEKSIEETRLAEEQERKRIQEELARKEKIEAVITTQSDSPPGLSILEHLSIVTASSTVTISDDSSRDKCHDKALFLLKEKALEKGANAIVGIETNTSEEEFYEFVGGPAGTPNIKQIRFRVSCTGTAVKTNISTTSVK